MMQIILFFVFLSTNACYFVEHSFLRFQTVKASKFYKNMVLLFVTFFLHSEQRKS